MNEPFPPITIKDSIFNFFKKENAFFLPSRFLNSSLLAVPNIVPPF
jgi:hypothetical protein